MKASLWLVVLGVCFSLGLCFVCGCDGDDDDDNDNPPPADTNAPPAGPTEQVLDSKNVDINSGATDATDAEDAPGDGTVTGTATWSGGGQCTATLVKNGAAVAAAADTSPIGLSGHTDEGDQWQLAVQNNTPGDREVHMVVSYMSD